MRKPLAATLIGVMTLCVAFVVAGSAVVTQAAEPVHINNAYHRLKRAHYILEHSCRHLGGHRSAAVKNVEAAISELRLAAKSVHASLPAVSQSSSIRAVPGQLHPHIHDAINQCNAAKKELAAAKTDFGGHRAKAMRQVDMAIANLQKAAKEPACKK